MIYINTKDLHRAYLQIIGDKLCLNGHEIYAVTEKSDNGGQAKATIDVHVDYVNRLKQWEKNKLWCTGVMIYDIACVTANYYHAEIDLIDVYGHPIITFHVSVQDKGTYACVMSKTYGALLAIRQEPLAIHDNNPITR